MSTHDSDTKSGWVLPPDAAQYNRGLTRAPADPLGLPSFPQFRTELDAMAGRLCDRLKDSYRQWVGGDLLSREMFGQSCTRTLRLLVAYARVHLKIVEIIGKPPCGYIYAEQNTDWGEVLLADAVERATVMGRSWLYIAGLHRRKGAAMAAAQMVFDWVQHHVPDDQRRTDELAAMFAAEGVGIGEILDAMASRLTTSDEGKRTLADFGQRHAQYLMTPEMQHSLVDQAEQLARQAADLQHTIQSFRVA